MSQRGITTVVLPNRQTDNKAGGPGQQGSGAAAAATAMVERLPQSRSKATYDVRCLVRSTFGQSISSFVISDPVFITS